MTRTFHTKSPVARSVLAGLLTASTLVFGQSTANSPTGDASPSSQSSTTTPNSGWQRVGEQSEVYDPNQNADAAYPAQAPDPNQQPPVSQRPAYPANGPGPYPSYGQSGNSQPYSPYSNNGQATGQMNAPQPPPVPAQLTVQRGTYVTLRLNQTLSSDKNQPGDAFTGSLVQPLVVNGVVVAEPGQTVGGQVVTAEKHHYDKPASLGIQLTNLTLVDGQQVPVQTQFVSRQGRTTSGGAEAGTVATTTGVGAIIGAAAGWGTGAAIGAGAGAAAGLIGVLITHNHASVLYPEQVLTFRIEAPLTISTANSLQAFRYIQPNEYDRPVYPTYASNGMYGGGAVPAPYYDYGYGSPYPYYGYGYDYGWGYPYWGPSIAFYGGYWRRGYYGRGYYPRGGYYGHAGVVGGGFRGGVSGGHAGGHR